MQTQQSQPLSKQLPPSMPEKVFNFKDEVRKHISHCQLFWAHSKNEQYKRTSRFMDSLDKCLQLMELSKEASYKVKDLAHFILLRHQHLAMILPHGESTQFKSAQQKLNEIINHAYTL